MLAARLNNFSIAPRSCRWRCLMPMAVSQRVRAGSRYVRGGHPKRPGHARCGKSERRSDGRDILRLQLPVLQESRASVEQVVKEDGHIRLVYKDWPILTKASVYGAQLALAAKYQGKYDAVHAALMSISGTEDS